MANFSKFTEIIPESILRMVTYQNFKDIFLKFGLYYGIGMSAYSFLISCLKYGMRSTIYGFLQNGLIMFGVNIGFIGCYVLHIFLKKIFLILKYNVNNTDEQNGLNIYNNVLIWCIMLFIMYKSTTVQIPSFLSGILAPLHNPPMDSGWCSYSINGKISDTNGVFALMPHGPGVYATAQLAGYLRNYCNSSPILTVASVFFKIPFEKIYCKMISNCTTVAPNDLIDAFQTKDPVIIYPGGFKDVFANSQNPNGLSISLEGLTRFYEMLKQTGKPLIPVIVENEAKNIDHPKLITLFFRWVHNTIAKVGIPTPYFGKYWVPFLGNDTPTIMTIGNPIYPNECMSAVDLREKFISAVQLLSKSVATPVDIKY